MNPQNENKITLKYLDVILLLLFIYQLLLIKFKSYTHSKRI